MKKPSLSSPQKKAAMDFILALHFAKLGRKKSAAKSAAARANGARGGRPKTK